MSSWIMKNDILSKKVPVIIELEYGSTLDILRKAKNASRKAALKRGGSSRMLQVVLVSISIPRQVRRLVRGVSLSQLRVSPSSSNRLHTKQNFSSALA